MIFWGIKLQHLSLNLYGFVWNPLWCCRVQRPDLWRTATELLLSRLLAALTEPPAPLMLGIDLIYFTDCRSKPLHSSFTLQTTLHLPLSPLPQRIVSVQTNKRRWSQDPDCGVTQSLCTSRTAKKSLSPGADLNATQTAKVKAQYVKLI